MLPLWILDLNGQSPRRDEFRRLVGQIAHVYMDVETPAGDAVVTTVMSNAMPAAGDGDTAAAAGLSKEDSARVARAARKTGHYWYYSTLDYDSYFTPEFIEPLTAVDEDTEVVGDDAGAEVGSRANCMYAFQEALIKQAKEFVKTLRASNIKPYQPVNVIVLGDATSRLTRMVFASIAAILQKEKGRFMPTHIHQGMTIFGMLYVPCDINTRDIAERKAVLRLFDEIEVQHRITNIRGYDHMMLFQDVQNRTECHYPILDATGQAQYMVQCLVNLFWACDIHHPLISGTGSGDIFYFSMGATSLFFDMTVEDLNDAKNVECDLITTFKENAEHEKAGLNLELLDHEVYKAEIFVGDNIGEIIQVDGTIEPVTSSTGLHPIWDFFRRKLKRLYYMRQLRYYPAQLLRDIFAGIEEQTSDRLEKISANSLNNYRAAQAALQPAIVNLLGNVNERHGGLSYVEYCFKKLQEHLSRERSRIQEAIKSRYWAHIIDETPVLPVEQMQHFQEYHDAYIDDVQTKNGGTGCDALKADELVRLKGLLSRERTVLGTLARSFLLGLMCVLGVVPILTVMSPRIINLGNVGDHAALWAAGVFMLPLLWQLVAYFLYLRTRDKHVRTLKAYYTHDAYARLANRIESEANTFYDRMIALAEQYLQRCKRVRTEVVAHRPAVVAASLLPTTMFNQPLNGGAFNGRVIIPEDDIERCRIRVNHEPRYVNTLSKAHFFLLINHMKRDFAMLFDGIEPISNNVRRFDEATGEYHIVSRLQLEQEQEQRWAEIKVRFGEQLHRSVMDEILPRQHPTIGEKLMEYRRRTGRADLLLPMLEFAAVNGEIISEFDTEYTDVKVNRDISELTRVGLPIGNCQQQVDNYDDVFRKFAFVTRWRCFEQISYNRLLPEEDFDRSVREQRVFTDEQMAKRRKEIEERFKDDDETRKAALRQLEAESGETTVTEYVKHFGEHVSSIILWAVCPDENSNEWLRLFDYSFFGTAYAHRNIFREKLNLLD